jgi:putative ABC transport system permease protein
MTGFLQDLRFAVRRLAQTRAFTITAVATLALGIGATTAIFSVLDAVVLRPLPFARPAELQMVWETMPGNATRWVAPANFVDWRRESRSFSGLAAYFQSPVTVTGGDSPERVAAVSVSSNFFELLGERPAIGRGLTVTDAAADAPPVIILGDDFWHRRYAGDPAVVGRDVMLDGRAHRVVGVMPPGFTFPETTDLWMAAPRDVPGLAGFPGDITQSRDVHYLTVIGRLRDGVSASVAHAEMDAIAARLAERYPNDNKGLGANVVSLHRAVVGDVGGTLGMLFAAVALVLIIACSNVASLLLSRADERSREAAICMALGATRSRMLSRSLAESLVLGAGGGVVGIWLAMWGVEALLALAPGDLPRVESMAIDARIVGFTFLVSLASSLCFGLLPAVRAWRLDLHALLRAGGRLVVGGPPRRLRGALVVGELALALTLLIGAGLLMRSVTTMMAVNPGFRADNLLSARIALPRGRYDTPERAGAMFGTLLERARATPNVVAASAVSDLPASGSSMNRGFVIDGRPAPERATDMTVEYRVVDPQYFSTMGMPVRRGRGFTEFDRSNAQRVATISETMARLYWPGADPLGARIALGDPARAESWHTVVGIVGDVAHFGLATPPAPEIYVPVAQSPAQTMFVVMRTTGEAGGVIGALRDILAGIDPDQPLTDVQTMTQRLTGSVARQRFVTTLLGLFAGVAVFLAVIGIYALMATMVYSRTKEIGLRMALGARAPALVRMFVGQGLRLIATGTVLGIAVSLLATRALGSLLFGVGATDPLTFIAYSGLLALVALAACWIPARRAARVDPMITLAEQ